MTTQRGKSFLARLIGLVVGFLLPIFPTMANAAPSAEIDACKYLLVMDFTSDPYGIAKELRAQARSKGFTVISTVGDVTPAESLKICVMHGSWEREAYGGEVAVRVLDASGALVNEAAASGTAWWSASRTVRGVVSKIYTQLGYTGYDEAAYQQEVQREYPKRPTVAVSEQDIKGRQPQSQVEGIWSDPENEYRLGIVPAPVGSGADYVAVILQSNSPVWQPSEVKAEIRTTASPEVFTCTYFMRDKKPAGTTLTLEHNAMLHGSISTPKGPFDLVLMRVWPKVSGETIGTQSANEAASGTGFLLSRAGLLATNWHVVSEAKNISVTFPGWSGEVRADLVVRDTVNDLAILRVADVTKLATTCTELPFQLVSSSSVTLGQHVSAIGYPLMPMLGSNPKFSEGVIASKSGWQDDPRSLQISAQVQPGSSGSPLLDSDGNIVGVVVATLDAAKVYQVAGAIPQNVNFAIKSDYLLNLAAMLPSGSVGSRTTSYSPEKAAQCVALIRAW